MNSWYSNLAVGVIINSITIGLGLTCNSTQKLRVDKGGQSICCFTTVCDKGEQFQLCNSPDTNDSCIKCPYGYTTGDAIDTKLVESHFNLCILPVCKDGATFKNGSCVCDTHNGYFGNDSDSCLFKQCDYGYILTNQGKCEECISGQYNCSTNNTRGISDSNRDQSPKWVIPFVLVTLVVLALFSISVFVYRLKLRQLRHANNENTVEIRMTTLDGKSSSETGLEKNVQTVYTVDGSQNLYRSVSRLERERLRQASPLPIRLHVPETEYNPETEYHYDYVDCGASTRYTSTSDRSSEYEQEDAPYYGITNSNHEGQNEDLDDRVDSNSSLTLREVLVSERENEHGWQSRLNNRNENQFGPCNESQEQEDVPYACVPNSNHEEQNEDLYNRADSGRRSSLTLPKEHEDVPYPCLPYSNYEGQNIHHYDRVDSSSSSSHILPEVLLSERENEPAGQRGLNDRNETQSGPCNEIQLQIEGSVIIGMFEQLKVIRKNKGKACQALQKEINEIQQRINGIKSMLTDMLSSGNQEQQNERNTVRREFTDEDDSVLRTMKDLKAKFFSEDAEYRRLEGELGKVKQLYNQAKVMMTEMLRSYDTGEEGRGLNQEQHGACGIQRCDAKSTAEGYSDVYYSGVRKS